MSNAPLIPNENPRRAPDSDEEPSANQSPTRRLNDDFLRVDLQADAQSQQPVGQPAAPGGYQYVQVPVYNVWTDPKVKGQLAMVMEHAKLTKNYGLTSMSPYCKVRVGHSMMKTTTVDNAGKNPVWNFRIALPLAQGVDMVYVEVFDSCVVQSDHMIGWTCVPIPEELILTGGDSPSKKYFLSGKQGPDLEGTISIRMSFTLSKDLAKSGVTQPPFHMMVPPSSAPSMMYPPYGTPMMVYPYAPLSPFGGRRRHHYYEPMMYPPYATAMVMSPYAMAGNTPVNVQPHCYPGPGAPHPQGQSTTPMSPPVIREEDVKSLKETFPDTDEEVIKGVLENCAGSRDKAAELLLQMG